MFGYIPIGGYTGTATSAGWVDRDGNPTATGSATVSQGNVSTVQLTYDVAGSLAVTLDGAAPAGTKLNVSQPGFVTPHTLTPTITAGETTVPTIGSLFPFKISPYNAYVGSCSDADPQQVHPTGGLDARDSGLARDALGVHLPRIAVTVTESGSALTTAAQREDHFDSHRLRRDRSPGSRRIPASDRPDALWALRGLR